MARRGRHVALLRGINVGGHHKLPMADLRAMFEDAGATDVQSYIASGNVVFSASAALAKKLGKTIAAQIEHDFGFSAPVLLRSAAQIGKVAAAHPFADRADDPKRLHFAFVDAKVTAEHLNVLREVCTDDEGLAAGDGGLYLWFGHGVAKTKLTNALIDRTLGAIATVRNWRTVQTLASLVEEL